MSNLQISLGIVGVLLIGAIIGHGLWTMRKNNQKLKAQSRSVAEKRSQSKHEGFDDDGIGSVRVVKKAAKSTESEPEQESETHTATERDETQTHQADDERVAEQMSMNLDLEEEPDAPLPSMRVDKDDEQLLQQEEMALNDNPSDDASSPVTEPEPEPETESAPTNIEAEEQPPEEVISLFVKGNVQGAVLLQMMTELGCKFGEMGIFHRYEQTSGNGPMIFSVANMFNPGTFDLDNIENFETDGVALFMTLPLNYDGQQAFNMMLNAAKKLAMEIPQGQVLDGDRQLLSRQSIQQVHQRIREFEKRSL